MTLAQDTTLPLPFVTPFIRYAEVNTWPRSFEWGPRQIYDHELVYVLSGLLHMKIGSRSFDVPADHIFMIPPREVHTFRAANNHEPQLHIGVHFDWSPSTDSPEIPYYGARNEPAVERLFREAQEVPRWDRLTTPLIDLRGRPRVRTLLSEVVHIYRSEQELSEWHASTLLAATIGQIAHEAILMKELMSNLHVGADAVRRVQQARQLLEAHRIDPLKISEIAREVGWTPDHLTRMCREILGATPLHIQTAARMRRAKRLLRQKDMTIDTVARQCGFKSASHFMSCFKKETGMTARQFMLFGEVEVPE